MRLREYPNPAAPGGALTVDTCDDGSIIARMADGRMWGGMRSAVDLRGLVANYGMEVSNLDDLSETLQRAVNEGADFYRRRVAQRKRPPFTP